MGVHVQTCTARCAVSKVTKSLTPSPSPSHLRGHLHHLLFQDCGGSSGRPEGQPHHPVSGRGRHGGLTARATIQLLILADIVTVNAYNLLSMHALPEEITFESMTNTHTHTHTHTHVYTRSPLQTIISLLKDYSLNASSPVLNLWHYYNHKNVPPPTQPSLCPPFPLSFLLHPPLPPSSHLITFLRVRVCAESGLTVSRPRSSTLTTPCSHSRQMVSLTVLVILLYGTTFSRHIIFVDSSQSVKITPPLSANHSHIGESIWPAKPPSLVAKVVH